jgi:hypothetical protein
VTSDLSRDNRFDNSNASLSAFVYSLADSARKGFISCPVVVSPPNRLHTREVVNTHPTTSPNTQSEVRNTGLPKDLHLVTLTTGPDVDSGALDVVAKNNSDVVQMGDNISVGGTRDIPMASTQSNNSLYINERIITP